MFCLGTLDHYRGARGIQKEHLPLCVATILLRAIDYGMTLACQPAGYWSGNYHDVSESSFFLRWCLQQHPLVFLTAALVCTAAYSLLILCWPRRPAEMIAGVAMLGHVYGVASWTFTTICGPVLCVALLYLGASLMYASAQTQQAERSRLGPIAV